MQRVGKRLSARRASPGMAIALAQRRNTAGDRFPAHPQGASQRLQSGVAVLAKGATAIPCGLRLDLNLLGRSASVIITWIEYQLAGFYRYGLDQANSFIIKIAMQIISLGQDVVSNQ